MTRKRAKKFTLLYDSKCAFCMRAWDNLKRLDKDNVLKGRGLYSASVRKDFPKLKLAHLKKELHIITPEGKVKKGADAFFAILPHLKKIGWLSHLTWIPGTKPISRFVYHSVAEHRTFLSRFLK